MKNQAANITADGSVDLRPVLGQPSRKLLAALGFDIAQENLATLDLKDGQVQVWADAKGLSLYVDLDGFQASGVDVSIFRVEGMSFANLASVLLDDWAGERSSARHIAQVMVSRGACYGATQDERFYILKPGALTFEPGPTTDRNPA